MVTAATLAFAAAASAQERRGLEIALSLGRYMPARQVALPIQYFDCFGPCDYQLPRQNPATAVGGRLAWWLGGRAAIEGAFWYAPSGVTPLMVDFGSGPEAGGVGGAGSILIATMRGTGSLVPRSRVASVLVTGGPAVVIRAGEAYLGTRGGTAAGVVVGTGVDLLPRHPFGLRAMIEDYMYKSNVAYRTPSGYTTGKIQHDVVMALSLRWLGRRQRR